MRHVPHERARRSRNDHDPTERLSWYLFAPVSTKRANHERAQAAMKDVCTKCHARSTIDDFYANAEQVVLATNEKVQAVTAVMDGSRRDAIISTAPFTEPIDFDEFDAWHFYGRTAKHEPSWGRRLRAVARKLRSRSGWG